MMQYQDFSIGLEFLTHMGRWRCTDIGTRTIIAIKISEVTVTTVKKDVSNTEIISDDPSWFDGPPYAVAEHVFDEDAFAECWIE